MLADGVACRIAREVGRMPENEEVLDFNVDADERRMIDKPVMNHDAH